MRSASYRPQRIGRIVERIDAPRRDAGPAEPDHVTRPQYRVIAVA